MLDMLNCRLTIPNEFISASGIPNSCKFFFILLMTRFTSRGSCWLSNKELAEFFSVSIPTIQKWLKCLKDKKFIRCKYDKYSRRNILILKRFSFNKKDKGTYYLSLPDFIVNDSIATLSATTKLILAAILSLSKNREKCCSASNRFLAMLFGVSGRTIRRHVAKLRVHNICQTIVEKIRGCVGGEYRVIYKRSIYPLIRKESAIAHMRADSARRPSKFFKKKYVPANNTLKIGKLSSNFQDETSNALKNKGFYYEKNGPNNLGNILRRLIL